MYYYQCHFDMESVIVGRNVRTWFLKFGSSRTKLVPLGMGMCLNSQMLVLIKLDFLFYSVPIILPVDVFRIGSTIPILSSNIIQRIHIGDL